MTTIKKAKQGVALRRLVRRRTKSLKLAIAIIRNEGMCAEWHFPMTANRLLRWSDELENEGGLKTKSSPSNSELHEGKPGIQK